MAASTLTRGGFFLHWVGALVLAIGTLWSFIHRCLSGQYDGDETDE